MFLKEMFVNTTHLKYIIEKQSAYIREFNIKLQQLKSKVSNNSDSEFEYISTDLDDFRSNSDAKGLVDYDWQNASDNNSVLTFDFKGKNIELENLPYEGDINADPYFGNTFVAEHNIIYGDINAAIASSDSTINENNKYKITFNGKLKLPQYSAGLFSYGYSDTASHTQYCKEIDLTNVDMNNIVNGAFMFVICENLTSLDLSSFTGKKLTNASNMFDTCYSLTSLDLSKFTGENLTNAYGMFRSCINLTTLSLPNFTGEKLTNVTTMFQNCTKLTTLNLSSFTGKKLTDASRMFEGCNNLTSLNLSSFTGENLVDAGYIFGNLYSLTELNLSSFTGKKLTDAALMFSECYSLESLSLSNFTGENVSDIQSMFRRCENLNLLDLSSFTGEKLESASSIFEDCSSLTTLIMKGAVINKIINLSESYLSLDTGVTIDNDKTYRCTCTYDDGVKITETTVI